MRFPLLVILVVCLAVAVRADWWDDFVDSVHEKLVSGADFIKEKAGPTIREKFDSVKATLQDPETHEKVQTWVKDEAVPTIKDKWSQFSDFVNAEVVPELKKVYDAASEAHRNVYQDEEGDTVIKMSRDN